MVPLPQPTPSLHRLSGNLRLALPVLGGLKTESLKMCSMEVKSLSKKLKNNFHDAFKTFKDAHQMVTTSRNWKCTKSLSAEKILSSHSMAPNIKQNVKSKWKQRYYCCVSNPLTTRLWLNVVVSLSWQLFQSLAFVQLMQNQKTSRK